MKRNFLVLASLLVVAITGYCQTVTLEWCPNPESDIAGYRLSYGSADITNWLPEVIVYADTNNICAGGIHVFGGTNWFRAYTNTIDVGNVTRFTVSNLVAGAAYYFAVSAYNQSNVVSGLSSEVEFRPKPLPPRNVRQN